MRKLFKAFPSYGKVIAIPKANACYLPVNQKDMILAWGMKTDSENTPKSILPTKMV